ncbi:MAG: acyl carrier protein [Kutzneria sp.]|nr:acyl carrier protein [Kutzneria sp.]
MLAELENMLRTVLSEHGMDDAEITAETSFHDDLELESIDLVSLARLMAERWGEAVNLAEFLAEKDLDEVIALRVGDLVDYVAGTLLAEAGS